MCGLLCPTPLRYGTPFGRTVPLCHQLRGTIGGECWNGAGLAGAGRRTQGPVSRVARAGQPGVLQRRVLGLALWRQGFGFAWEYESLSPARIGSAPPFRGQPGRMKNRFCWQPFRRITSPPSPQSAGDVRPSQSSAWEWTRSDTFSSEYAATALVRTSTELAFSRQG